MNRGRISVGLYLLMLMFLMVMGCTSSDNVAPGATTVTFTQADLEGNWNVQTLFASGAWMRFIAETDAEGFVTPSGCDDSTGGSTYCPPDGYFKFTIDSNGVVSAWENSVSGYVLSVTLHGRMTLGKNLIATTDGGDMFWIAQKVPAVPANVYTADDLKNKSVVLHGLLISPVDEHRSWWTYGTGYIDSKGEMYLSSTDAPFIENSLMDAGAIAVSPSSGVVTALGDDIGFLSADKKTIVGTLTMLPSDWAVMMIIQVTGDCDDDGNPTSAGPFTLGPIPAGTYSGHFLGVQDDVASDFWVHYLFSVDSLGKILFDPSDPNYWVSSNPSLVTAPTGDDYIYIMSPYGTVRSSLNNSYHGQISSDGMFIVGTRTNPYWDSTANSGAGGYLYFYSLGIDIRTNGVAAPEEAATSIGLRK